MVLTKRLRPVADLDCCNHICKRAKKQLLLEKYYKIIDFKISFPDDAALSRSASEGMLHENILNVLPLTLAKFQYSRHIIP